MRTRTYFPFMVLKGPMMSIATFCHGPSGGEVGVSGAWYILYCLSLEAHMWQFQTRCSTCLSSLGHQ